MEPTRRSHAYCAIVRHRSRPRLKISLALRKVPLAASRPSGVSARLGGSSGPRSVASAVGICNTLQQHVYDAAMQRYNGIIIRARQKILWRHCNLAGDLLMAVRSQTLIIVTILDSEVLGYARPSSTPWVDGYTEATHGMVNRGQRA
ncbi:hypothetical protein EDB89DRAFT_1910428 [Lactarius sanguifluus]|nr:hypothetical protein EDB89DRAFT_1910428 [Lactarius sanguifluus]